MAARACRTDKERRELHPPAHNDVVDLDPSLDQLFLDIAAREAVSQLPANREDNHLWRGIDRDLRRELLQAIA